MGSSAGAIRAGKAYVEIYGDDNALQRTLNKASKSTQKFGEYVRNIGATLFAAGGAIKASLTAAVAVFEESGTALRSMSLRTGASVESLSTLGFAAEQSGLDMEGLEAGIRKMQKTIGGMEENSAEAALAIAKLGLNFEDIQGKKPEDQFREIGARLAAIHDPTERAAEAMRIFGKSGTSLLPLFSHGAAGLAELEEKARELGLEWSGPETEAAAKLHHAMTALWATIKKGTANIGGALAEDLTGLVVSATNIAAATGKWIKENKGLVIGLNLAAGAIMAVGAAAIVAGVAISAAGTIIGGIAAVAAFVTSAWFLIPAAVIAAAGAFLYFSGVGGKVLDWIMEKFEAVKAVAMKVFGGISDALSAGDFKLAAQIAMLSIQAEWIRGTNVIKSVWRSFELSATEVGLSIAEAIGGPIIAVIGEIKKAFIEVESLLAKNLLKAKMKAHGDSDLMINMAMMGMDISAGTQKGMVDKDTANQKALLPDALANMHRKAIGAAADADAADAAKLTAAEKARDDAIAMAAKNRADGNTDNAHAGGFDVEAAKESKHGPIAGVDIKSTEGFKAVLGAINEGQNNPQADAAMSLREMKALAKKQQKDQHDLLLAFRKLNTVGF